MPYVPRSEVRFVRGTSGYVECPGSFMGDHTPVEGKPNQARCAHCQNTITTVFYGAHLKRHFVPAYRGVYPVDQAAEPA